MEAGIRTFPSGRSHTLRGYIYIATATFLWSVSATLGRAAFTGRLLPGGKALAPIDPLILSQSRVTISFLILLPVLLWWRGPKRLRLPPADILRTVLLGVLGTASANYLYYLGIQRTNVATAIILQYTAPVWVLLYTFVRGVRKPTFERVAAVALAVMGITLVTGVFGAGGLRLDAIGVAAALLSAFAFAFYAIFGHGIFVRCDRWVVLLYMIGSASLFWALVNPPWKLAASQYSKEQGIFLVVFSLVSALAPFSFYAAGLEYLEPTRAIVVSCLEPVFAIVLAAIALGEILRPLQTAGIVLVLTAIVVVQISGRGAREPVTIVEPIE